MDQFLESVERRAYCIAKMAVGQREDALDIVQDAMLKLVQLYADKPEQEWRCLFFKILQSRIRDWYRRNKVRNRWRVWLDKLGFGDEGNEDPLARMADPAEPEPSRAVNNERSMDRLNDAVEQLPLRQQQAFLLRAWEGLTEEETARAMGCSKGSVKTHYSRAREALRNALEEYVIEDTVG